MIKRFTNSAEKLSAILSLSSEVFFSNKKLNHSYCRPLTLLLCAIQQLNFSDSLRFLCAHFLHDWLHKIFLCQTQKQIAENVAHQASSLLFPLRSIHSTNHYHNLFPAITVCFVRTAKLRLFRQLSLWSNHDASKFFHKHLFKKANNFEYYF